MSNWIFKSESNNNNVLKYKLKFFIFENLLNQDYEQIKTQKLHLI